jgi:hypothetical protein
VAAAEPTPAPTPTTGGVLGVALHGNLGCYVTFPLPIDDPLVKEDQLGFSVVGSRFAITLGQVSNLDGNLRGNFQTILKQFFENGESKSINYTRRSRSGGRSRAP